MADAEIAKGVWVQCVDADTPNQDGLSPANCGLLTTGNVHLCAWAGQCDCCGEMSICLEDVKTPGGQLISFEAWRFKPLGGGKKLEAPKTGVKKKETAK